MLIFDQTLVSRMVSVFLLKYPTHNVGDSDLLPCFLVPWDDGFFWPSISPAILFSLASKVLWWQVAHQSVCFSGVIISCGWRSQVVGVVLCSVLRCGAVPMKRCTSNQCCSSV